MPALQRPYPSVQNNRRFTYGGNQMLSRDKTIRKCGCGPVAALDLTLYLKSKRQWEAASPLPLSYYNEKLSQLCRHYFPLIPPFGINVLVFLLGLNRLLRDEGLSYRAQWAVSGARLWARVTQMLEQDIPVILTVGPDFPAIWQANRLNLYVKRRDDSYVRAASTKSHYVTATGLDSEWARVSSWGREYYINRTEYDEFVKKHSTYLFSNLVYLKPL